MITFGVIDEGKKTVFTIEAKTAKEAIDTFKRLGYNGWVYQVSPLPPAAEPVNLTANRHFSNAAEIARKGRE